MFELDQRHPDKRNIGPRIDSRALCLALAVPLPHVRGHEAEAEAKARAG
eukprot:CAMPEP_0206581324 /NCGR_PEP_ID=MMETSP0325_2-20121206/33770_1 /ASSEMBLY_ACC=CAM_ASM_000347 /TAXON_ID=2866 /ORGANISM="Crypthecodinium cohnii, Strain Seligo" /LENGTH=48 /DNA_ID= /DNA_START= /DNA_END= /DNA_ORIENTATION=